MTCLRSDDPAVTCGDGDGTGACMVHNPGDDFNDGNVAIGSACAVLPTQPFLATRGPGTTQ